MSEKVKCKKCGFENPSNLKFCGNCGARLSVTAITPKFEGLALLHITGSAYLIISLIFNALVQASVIFMIPYIASGLLGLYAGYEFYTSKAGKWLKIISALAIIIGLVSTSLLFLIGLEVRGVIGPAWVIFLINAWMLWKERVRL
ncbi:MAG: zinc ribbon domain-containing protein [archaeon]|nr:zinc ribbon domain-containing protein [archaeon]MCP8320087.1 zinc ribbon domain-containing protein [archaeon]